MSYVRQNDGQDTETKTKSTNIKDKQKVGHHEKYGHGTISYIYMTALYYICHIKSSDQKQKVAHHEKYLYKYFIITSLRGVERYRNGNEKW